MKFIKILLMCSLLAFCLSCSNNSIQIDLELIPVESDGKWGYINQKGEYVINLQFKDADFFYNDLACVTTFDDKIGYISKKGEYIIPAQYKEGTRFSEGLAFVVSEDSYPVCIDKSGKTKFELKEAEMVVSFSEGLALFVDNDDKYGYVDKKGNVVVKPQFEFEKERKVIFDIKYKGLPKFIFSNKLAAFSNGKQWGYIDVKGNYAINPQFDEAGSFNEGLAAIKLGNLWGYIDTKGNYVINPQFDYASSFSEGMAPIKSGKLWGHISKDGKIMINPQFDHTYWFSNGLALIEQNDKYGYIDKTGKVQINPQFDNAYSFFENIAIVEVANKWGIIDSRGKYLVNPQFDAIKFDEWSLYNNIDYVESDYDPLAARIKKAQLNLTDLMQLLQNDNLDNVNTFLSERDWNKNLELGYESDDPIKGKRIVWTFDENPEYMYEAAGKFSIELYPEDKRISYDVILEDESPRLVSDLVNSGYREISRPTEDEYYSSRSYVRKAYTNNVYEVWFIEDKKMYGYGGSGIQTTFYIFNYDESVELKRNAKIEEDRLRAEIEKNRNNLGVWKIGYYVDDFGDPTNSPYITTVILGKYHTSGMSNEELRVVFLIDDYSIRIQLYEYTFQDAAPINGRGSITFKIRDKNNNEYTIQAYNDDKGNTNVDSEDTMKLMNILKSGGKIRFSAENTRYSHRYNFTIENADFFDNAMLKMINILDK
ncbi:WG repeat-containing protein [Odoribacter sp. OttesenSCG-928-L07]|nr:WG repeat-containing protein [Odoribacter sp. OttesenSCG-928-L07]MDL2238671.1 WG repeat-containing protein [Bacteroidales bacterium OttesenSCG-928-L14]